MTFHKKLLSPEALHILETKTGFRDEACYGSGVTKFTKVLEYETCELGNKDIYDTIKRIYGLRLDMRRTCGTLNHLVSDFVTEHFNCAASLMRCCWVCSNEEQVKTLYGSEDVRKITFDGNILIASDLGPQGVLIICHDYSDFRLYD